jgi:hypothetical protein
MEQAQPDLFVAGAQQGLGAPSRGDIGYVVFRAWAVSLGTSASGQFCGSPSQIAVASKVATAMPGRSNSFELFAHRTPSVLSETLGSVRRFISTQRSATDRSLFSRFIAHSKRLRSVA